MEIERLLAFVARENRRLRETHSTLEEGNATLVQAIKLNEELGEFCDSVLAYHALQRDGRPEEFEAAKLENEFADVLVATLLLADSLDIDVETALERKVELVERRYE